MLSNDYIGTFHWSIHFWFVPIEFWRPINSAVRSALLENTKSLETNNDSRHRKFSIFQSIFVEENIKVGIKGGKLADLDYPISKRTSTKSF